MAAIATIPKAVPVVKPTPRFPETYLYLTVLLSVVFGLILFFNAGTNVTQFREGHDLVLKAATETVLLAASILYFVLGVYLFAARDMLNRAVMILWAGVVHLGYWLGLLS